MQTAVYPDTVEKAVEKLISLVNEDEHAEGR
jgi:hypothetical protein